MIRNTFKKAERLTNKRIFESIFESGKSISVFPFKLIWIETNTTSPTPLSLRSGVVGEAQLGISVPKKSFAKAVDRNTIKRRIRESYRKNKHSLYEMLKEKNLSIALMIIYISKEELPYQEIEKKMIVSLQKVQEIINV
ncbi:MAG: ribonuclease P protein component [Bacteroidetes bacterium]|nr:ribonuclease P protein component [Bacteroidota bacterium]